MLSTFPSRVYISHGVTHNGEDWGTGIVSRDSWHRPHWIGVLNTR